MISTKDEFKQLVENIQSQSWYKNPIGFGIARVDRGQLNKNKILQATFPVVNWNENFSSAAVFLKALKVAGEDVDTSKSELVCKISDEFLTSCIEAFKPLIPEAKAQNHKNVQVISTLATLPIDSGLSADDYRVVFIFDDTELQSTEAVYLKLCAVSSGKASLKSLNLNNASKKLHTCAWVGNHPVELDWLRENEIVLKIGAKYPIIDFVDKFPKFLQHIIPTDNTTISESSSVKLGDIN